MQEEFNPAAEKILSDIYQIFHKDLQLKSFEVLLAQQYQNKTPIRFEEHCLALESWCVPHVYCYAYKNLIKIRESKGRKIRDAEICDKLLVGALLLNPHVTTFWNMRKEMLSSGKLDPLFELKLTSVILTYKPKCADIYSHRKWLLNRLLHESPEDLSLIENELEICEVAADHYSNNYHAWTHRIWCLSQSTPALVQREWTVSLRWVQRHVSDFSGFHYRQKLICSLVAYIQSSAFQPETIKSIIFSVDEAAENFLHSLKNLELTIQTIPIALRLLVYELLLSSELIWSFIGHEALWSHRRFIFSEIKKFLFDTNLTKLPWGYFETSNHSNSDGAPIEKTLKIGVGNICDQFSLVLSLYEEIFLKKCTNENDKRQTEYASKHKEWLSKFSKFQLPYDSDNNCSLVI